MSGLFGKIIKSTADAVKMQRVTIPITSSMLEYLIMQQPIKGVEQLRVVLADERLTISGRTKKLLIPISFTISLKPKEMEKRVLHFEVDAFSPADIEFVKRKVLNRPPFINYEPNVVTFDLNGLDIVSKVPYGSIHGVEIKENKLWVQIGL